MPKKVETNNKAEEARERKAMVDLEKKMRVEREAEDQFCSQAEGPKSKSMMKKEEKAKRKAKATTKRVEAKTFAEKEKAEIGKSLKGFDKKSLRAGIPKVTVAELAKGREEENLRSEAGRQAARKRDGRTANEEDYERLVMVENTNGDDMLVDARNIDVALAQMGVFCKIALDRHPERRLKASYRAFEDAKLPRLKEEKPGLTLTQYKDLLGKMWRKSPENPLNQNTLSIY